jgi:hypothetical protein
MSICVKGGARFGYVSPASPDETEESRHTLGMMKPANRRRKARHGGVMV